MVRASKQTLLKDAQRHNSTDRFLHPGKLHQCVTTPVDSKLWGLQSPLHSETTGVQYAQRECHSSSACMKWQSIEKTGATDGVLVKPLIGALGDLGHPQSPKSTF